MQPASNDSELPPLGTVVAGKYQLVRVIGRGGMGVVFEAKHLKLKQRVAIKMLKPTVLGQPEVTPRFDREARTAALLRGRHVARTFDVDVTEGGLPFMVMEYLVGRDLDAELQERGTLSVEEATGYVLQACIAMQEAHAAGIVHRDLKPANLFLTEESGMRVVKVLDFGISKFTSDVDAHLTATFATVGTPLYMSPEQVRGSKAIDARTDVWSLAVILYEALAGKPPFLGSMTATAAAIVADEPPSLRALRPDVPPELEAVLIRALEKSPAKRYPDVASLSDALTPYGPSRLPFGTLGDASNPILPPTSSPSPSTRVSSDSVRESRPEASTVAETMLIAPSVAPRAGWRSHVQVVAVALLVALGLVAAALMLRPVAQRAAAPPSTASVRPDPSPPSTPAGATPPLEPATLAADRPAVASAARPPVAVTATNRALPTPTGYAGRNGATPRPSSRPPSTASTAPNNASPNAALPLKPANPIFLQ